MLAHRQTDRQTDMLIAILLDPNAGGIMNNKAEGQTERQKHTMRDKCCYQS